MTRLAIISDQHFDVHSRWDEHRRLMAWVVEDLRAKRPDAILLGGDIYERAPCPEEVRAACEWLIALADIAPVVGVRGNHDPFDSTVPFNHLMARHPITFYEQPAVHVSRWGSIACLPWPSRAQLLTATRGMTRDQANQAASVAFEQLLRGLGQQMNDYPGHRVFLGHVQLCGATVSTGQPMAPGADFELGLADLGILGAHAYLLGHIHRGSMGEAEIDGAPCFYPGSPRRTAFGELEAKGYGLVDLDADRPTVTTFVETPCRPMHLVEDEWTDEGWLSGPCIEEHHFRGAEVRLRYHVNADQRDAARAAVDKYLQDFTSWGVVDVKVEERVRAVTKARAPEITRAKTLLEKLEALWAMRGVELTDERRARLAAKVARIQEAA